MSLGADDEATKRYANKLRKSTRDSGPPLIKVCGRSAIVRLANHSRRSIKVKGTNALGVRK